MIGTEGVLVPDIPSPLNSETLDITDYNYQQIQSVISIVSEFREYLNQDLLHSAYS